MQPLLLALPTLAVSAIYCLWSAYRRRQLRRRRVLCDRLAYLLWVVAEQVPSPTPTSRSRTTCPRRSFRGSGTSR